MALVRQRKIIPFRVPGRPGSRRFPVDRFPILAYPCPG